MIRQVLEISKREEEERLTKIEVQEKQQLKTAEIASIAVAAKLNNLPSVQAKEITPKTSVAPVE